MMETAELESKAVETLAAMIKLLGVAAEVRPVTEADKPLKLAIVSEESGRLIGRKGLCLESLELLLNRILKRQDEQNPWVAVEIDGYTTGRTGDAGHRRGGERVDVERFENMARDAAKEVKRWQSEKKLGPYSPAERRIIHITLESDDEVATSSEEVPGESNLKYVLIKLK